MRHAKHTFKVGRNGSHRRCMIANMLKDLIIKGRIETTVVKAKELKRHADRMITLAKKDDLSARRRVKARLMIRHNALTSKEARAAKNGDLSAYNNDRNVLKKLFEDLKTRFLSRQGGYTRIIKKGFRVGDSAPTCFIEYLEG